MRAVIGKDLRAIRRSNAVLLPMIIVPALLLVLLPLAVGIAARATHHPDVHPLLDRLPHSLGSPIARLPEREQLVVLVDGYLVAPLFLIVPLMVASVLAADAFAGEKERKTLESLLHLPISDERLFYAKVIGAFGPAVGVAWIGFVLFAIVANTLAWPLTHRILSVMVRVSARARTGQEANQLGGSVILPLIFVAVAQSAGLLLIPVGAAFAVGTVVWALAIWLLLGGARRFTRDRVAVGL